MLDRFWRSLDRWLKIVGAPDLVLLTGDLTNRGERAEFDKLSKFLEKLLLRLPKASNGLPPLVVAVPGNHDLQRPSGREALPYRVLRDYEKGRDDPDVASLLDELWGKSDASFLRPLFAHYQEWFDDFIRPQTMRPGVKLHTSFFPGDLLVSLDLPGRFPLAIVGLNSTWMQYQGGEFEGKLALPVEQFHAALPRADGESPLIALEGHHRALLMMHHPRGWLSKSQQRLFDGGVYPGERFAACFHGHMHEADSVNTSRAGGTARCYYQAPSLFGMEDYGSDKESRAFGYTWAALRDDGELRAWPLKAQRKGDGVEDFDRDTFFHWEDGLENVLLRAGDGRCWSQPLAAFGADSGRANSSGGDIRVEVAEPAAVLTYRTWLVKQRPGVKLIGVGGGDMSLDLDAVYVPLRAAVQGLLGGADGTAIRELGTGGAVGGATHAEQRQAKAGARRAGTSKPSHTAPGMQKGGESDDFAVDTLFLRIATPHALILGEPGSGKTTALHKLQHVCSREGPEALGLPAGTLPVPLSLRRFTTARRDKPLAVWLQDELVERSRGELPEELGAALWAHGRLLVLADGLDEIADEELRAKLCGYLEAQLRGPAAVHMRSVVSCRFAGYRRAVALDSRFTALELRPLGAAQVRELVKLWFAEAALKVPGVSPAEAQERGQGLIAAIESPAYSIQRLKVMVSTPLLLTLLCVIVHQGRQMPKSRVAYYERCLEVLLLRWGQEHQRREAPLDLERALAVLRPLAYALHASGERDSKMRAALVLAVNRRLRSLGLTAKGIPVVEWLQRDAGVLQEFSPEHLGFAHLGLQEYLAATHIAEDEELLGELVDKLGDEWWQEVALLVAAQRVAFQSLMRRALRTQLHRGDLIDALLDEAPEAEPTPLLQRLGELDEPREIAAVLRLLRRFRHDPKVREAASVRQGNADAEVRALAAQILESREQTGGGECDVVLVFLAPHERLAEQLARKLAAKSVQVFRDVQGRLPDAMALQGDLAAPMAAAPCVVALCGKQGPAWAEPAAASLLEMFADAGKELAWVQLPGAEDSAWPIEFGVSRRIDLRASGGMDELRRWLATARHGTRGIVQGEPFTEETTDIRFLWVKGGSFDMGMKGVAEPVHRVNLSPYWLAETPVTNAQYAKFLAEVPGYQEPLYWRDRRFSGEKQPVVGVTWDDANLFCVWLSQQAALLEAGVRVVLPSEAQWELAARGNDGRRFPWGNSPPDPTRAVYGRKDGTVRVGSCPAGQGPLGHLDLVGNVWQWCRNRWDDEADEWQPRGGISEPVEPNREDIRVLRGSPWTHDGVLPAAERRRLGGRGRSGGGGFRVAAVPEIG
jgi:formylglycine-generating enzyme required for sulfatase activity